MSKDMTTGKPLHLILPFALPLLLGNLFQQVYSMADTAIVGRFIGKEALAAVGATVSVSGLVLGFAIGIAAGFGFYVVAVAGMIFTLITLTIFEALQRKLIHNHSAEDRFLIRTTDVPAALELINKAAAGPKVTIFELNATRQEDGYRITFRAWFTGRKNEQRRREFFAKLVSDACIEEVSYQSNAESKV